MTNLLIRIFIRNGEQTTDPAVREKYGKLAGSVGILANLLLCGMKICAGWLFGSISVLADGVNNLSDAGTSLLTLVGFKLSGKPADEKHPFGHARMEYITGFIISFLILFLGFELGVSSLEKIFSPEKSQFSLITVAILILSILIKLWLGLFNRKMGKKISSLTLAAAASDSFNDVISTAAVLVTLLVSRLTGFELDGYVGLAVAALILVSGIRMAIDTANPLLGAAPSGELVSQLEQKILSYEGVIGLHDLTVHDYGPERCFASVHVEVPAAQDILESHDIIDQIEMDCKKEMGLNLVIHLDPVITDNEEVTRLKNMTAEIVAGISHQLSIHDFRVVFGQTHTNLVFDVCVPHRFALTDKELSGLIGAGLKSRDPLLFAVITFDRSYVAPKPTV
ncbi:MAG: cation transporter [Oscillospiraceae bacterium]|nr:cation transporter [Oscillospiraceae bacterium]MBQ8731349.1 cation transporter [Oscillospiraceae bacterium]